MNQNKTRKNRSLSKKINNYLLTKNDICCEDDIDRNTVIDKIFKNYEKVAELMDEKYDYLSYVANDIPIFIGYKNDLKKVKDNQGVRLWNTLYNSTLINKVAKKERITKTLNELPLYYLLAILGYSDCKMP